MVTPTNTAVLAALVGNVEHFARRVIVDALTQATATHWIGRAETFRAARPTLEDYRGQATPAELTSRWHALTEIAEACDHRAEVALIDAIPADLTLSPAEVAELERVHRFFDAFLNDQGVTA